MVEIKMTMQEKKTKRYIQNRNYSRELTRGEKVIQQVLMVHLFPLAFFRFMYRSAKKKYERAKQITQRSTNIWWVCSSV